MHLRCNGSSGGLLSYFPGVMVYLVYVVYLGHGEDCGYLVDSPFGAAVLLAEGHLPRGIVLTLKYIVFWWAVCLAHTFFNSLYVCTYRLPREETVDRDRAIGDTKDAQSGTPLAARSQSSANETNVRRWRMEEAELANLNCTDRTTVGSSQNFYVKGVMKQKKLTDLCHVKSQRDIYVSAIPEVTKDMEKKN